jgi:hypothetical protein
MRSQRQIDSAIAKYSSGSPDLGSITFLRSIEKVLEVWRRGSFALNWTVRCWGLNLDSTVAGFLYLGSCVGGIALSRRYLQRQSSVASIRHRCSSIMLSRLCGHCCTQLLLKRTDIRLSGIPGFNLFNNGHFADLGPTLADDDPLQPCAVEHELNVA